MIGWGYWPHPPRYRPTCPAPPLGCRSRCLGGPRRRLACDRQCPEHRCNEDHGENAEDGHGDFGKLDVIALHVAPPEIETPGRLAGVVCPLGHEGGGRLRRPGVDAISIWKFPKRQPKIWNFPKQPASGSVAHDHGDGRSPSDFNSFTVRLRPVEKS